MLKKLNVEIILTSNGKEAYEHFNKSKFDLVFMDIQMPVMDGMEATELIREFEKDNDLNPVPIIAITAHSMDGDRERFLNSGMDDYISKPIDKNRLGIIIDKWIK